MFLCIEFPDIHIDKCKNIAFFNTYFQTMHQYLLQICGLLLISSCFLWEVSTGAYVSYETTTADQPSTLQEEGMHQIPFDALISSFGSLFSDVDSSRSSKSGPTHDFLHTTHHAGLKGYALYLIKPVKTLHHLNSRNIYLLDCAFLI